MNKVCFISTQAIGPHQPFEKVYKKNLFGFSRMVSFSWIIASRTNNDKYVVEKEHSYIIKPRCMVIPPDNIITNEIAHEQGTEIETVLSLFRLDIKDRSLKVFISKDLDFHLRTLQAELVRYNMAVDFNKYLLIDIGDLFEKVYINKMDNIGETYMKYLKKECYENDCMNICELFFHLYNMYESRILDT